MYIYTSLYLQKCIFIQVSIYGNVYLYTSLLTEIYIYTRLYLQKYIFIHVSTYRNIYLYTSLLTEMYIYTRLYLRKCILIHVYVIQANTPKEGNEPESDELEGIAGALARALGARNKALANDSDHSEDESDDDWSD